MTRRHGVTKDRPIFVDRTGTRRTWLTVIGAITATALLTGLVALIMGLVATGSHSLPGLPGFAPQRANEANPPVSPTPSALVTATPSAPASTTPTPTATRTSQAPPPSPTPTKVTGKPTGSPGHPRPTKTR